MQRQNLYVRHITGPKEYETVCSQLELDPDQQARWQVVGYEDHMGEVMAACDCIVSRAGATSLAEISARQIPALLVPFPYATADHQTTNAQENVAAGAALMVADADVETEAFTDALFKLVDDDAQRAAMHQAAAIFATRDASGKLADVVIAAGAPELNDTIAS